MSIRRKCEVCNETIESEDWIIIGSEGGVYHNHCVTLYPTGYTIFDGGDFLEEADDDDQLACIALRPGEYIEEEDVE